MDTIQKIDNGNVLFLQNGEVESTQTSTAVAKINSPKIIIVTGENNSATIRFKWQSITALILPSGPISIPTDINDFLQVLSEFFFTGVNATGQAGATSANQVIMIANQDEIITNQETQITQLTTIDQLLRGPNYSSTPMTYPTRPDNDGVYYMLRTFRATELSGLTVNFLAKTLSLLILTPAGQQQFTVCLFKNPIIANDALIDWNAINSTIEQGMPEDDDPTPQFVDVGDEGEIVMCVSLGTNDLNLTQLNLDISLDDNNADVLFLGVRADDPNEELEAILSFLQLS